MIMNRGADSEKVNPSCMLAASQYLLFLSNSKCNPERLTMAALEKIHHVYCWPYSSGVDTGLFSTCPEVEEFCSIVYEEMESSK